MSEPNNPYLALVQGETAANARRSLMAVADKQPDTEAKLQALAKRYNLPVDSVRFDQPDIERRAKLDAVDYGTLAKSYPHTGRFLGEPDQASIAHDDIDNLTQLEAGFKALRGPSPSVGNMAYGLLKNLVPDLKMPSGDLASLSASGPLHSSLKLALHDAFNSDGGISDQTRHNDLQRQALQAQAALDSVTPEFETATARGLYSGAASFMRTLPAMALSVATANPLPVLASAGAQQAAPAYSKYLDRGATRGQAALGALGEGATEVGFELLPMGFMVKNFGKMGAGKFLTGLLSREIPTEQMTTVVQDAIDTAIANPDKTWGDFIAERPDAAYQTLLATVAQGGITAAISTAARQLSGRNAQSQTANQQGANLEHLNRLAAASKILKRSPGVLKTFIDGVLEDSQAQNLYIDAKTFAQSGVADQVMAALPDVAAQMQQALATGGEIRIPVSAYMTGIANTEHAGALADHLRLEGEDMTRAEAQVYMQTNAEVLQKEVEKVLSNQQRDTRHAASLQTVKDSIKDKLANVSRFTEPVNDAYATLMSNFYAVQADKLGMAPEELFTQYPVNIAAEGLKGGRVFGQVLPGAMPDGMEQGDGNKLAAMYRQEDATQSVLLGQADPRLIEDGAKGNAYLDTFSHSADQSALNHIRTRHGDSGTELQRGQLPVRDADIAQIDDIVKNYDAVRFDLTSKSGKPMVAYAKQTPDGALLYFEEAHNKRHDLAAHAMRRYPATSDAVDILHNVPLYAQNDGRHGHSIGKPPETIKPFNGLEASKTPIKEGMTAIEVDGAQRPVLNSKGQLIHPTEEGVRNFWRWFGDSKVVDGQGRPLVVYHGTNADFSEFSKKDSLPRDTGDIGYGHYFSENNRHASVYANETGGNVAPVYLNIREPLRKFTKTFNSAVDATLSDVEATLSAGSMDGKAIVKNDSPKGWGSVDTSTPENNALMARSKAITSTAIANGHDGIWAVNGRFGYTELVAFEPNQIKSAIGNTGEFNPNDANILHQSSTGDRGSFNPETRTITLLRNADLSTFLHESGHFFLDMQMELSARLMKAAETAAVTPAQQKMLADNQALLDWFGLQSMEEWYALDFEQTRSYHEKFAESFEHYLFTGKAPSIDLQSAFQNFRNWLLNVYNSIKDFLNNHPQAGTLSDEVRSVFDRMLASQESIKLAEEARNLMPLFDTAEEAGMTAAEFANYQALGHEATDAAIDQLQSKSLADTQWLQNARSKALKNMQKQHDALRREVRSEVATDIMAQPVYRAWAFLTRKQAAADKIAPASAPRPKSDPNHLDATQDSLFAAIAKLGGLQRSQLTQEWNYDHQGRDQSPVFGKPVVRKTGGHSLETMAEMLLDAGYLTADAHGKHDLHEFEKKFSDELRGVKQYSHSVDGGLITEPDTGIAGSQVINPAALDSGKLELAELRGMGLPEDIVQRLVALKMTAKDGLHPDIVTDLIGGFSSGDELARALAAAEPPATAIERLTDQRLLHEHSELATPAAVQRAADRAVANDLRAFFVATEADALAKATGSVRLLAAAAKDYATALIARMKVKDIKPHQYARAEIRAARAAEQASKAGDIEQAATEKRNQLINLHARKAAYKADAEIDKMLRYFKGLRTGNKSIDREYLEQIRGLLAKFYLSEQSSGQLEEASRLRGWVQAQMAEGQLPIVAETLLNPRERAAYIAQIETRDSKGQLVYADDEERLRLLAEAIDRSAVRPYQEATYEELQGLNDTIKQIEHLGRLKHKLLATQDERTFEDIRDGMVSSIIIHGGKGGLNTRTPNDVLGKLLAGVKDFGAAHIKVATWARIMDGGLDNGPVWRYLVKPANERSSLETTMKAASTTAVDAILRPVLAKVSLFNKSGKGKHVPSIGTSLNWQERFTMLLNMGNESNLQRLMAGGIANVTPTLTMPQILDVVGSLSWDEVYAAQRIWDHFESYRPLIAAKEKRVTGVEPNWIPVRAIDIKVKDGRVITLRGGYYPVRFDTRVNIMAAAHAAAQDAKDLMKASYSAATTRRSFIKDRVEEVHGRPLLLNLNGIYTGINDVIHDLAWHEWVIDANKILRSSKVDEAIREYYGADVKKQLDNWRNDIVTGQRKLDHGIEKAAAIARQYVSASALTFNLVSAAMQPLGISNSIARIGAAWVGKGIARTVAHPIQATKDAQAKSEWLRNRTRTRFRELNELRNQVQGQTAAKEFMGHYGYWLMMRAQLLVDIPTWWGGYEKGIAQGFDEDTAIALADQGVKDSQGGGEEVDQSGIERGHALVKLFTAFYGFMGTTLNTAYGSTVTETSKAKIAVNLLLTLSVPAVLGTLVRQALVPSGDDDDDEGLAEKLIREQLGFLIGLVAFGREFTPLVKPTGLGYSGPTGLRVIPDSINLGHQWIQGDYDDAFRKQFINVLGDLTGIPAVQVNRTWTGIEALQDDKTDNPLAVGFGFRK